LQAWKSKDSFRGESKFSTWLYKVALNTVLTALRKNKKNFSTNDYEVNIAAEDSSLVKDKYEVLQMALKSLNEADRSIIIMHLDGFTNPEIADFMGISINHTNVKIHRIKNKITETIKKFEDYGMD
jgi:RNA polymerase sigma-70 factor (ECF subfamily)